MAEVNIFEGVDEANFCSTCPVVECAKGIQNGLELGMGLALEDPARQALVGVSEVLAQLRTDDPIVPNEARIKILRIADTAEPPMQNKLLICARRQLGSSGCVK